MKEIAIMFFTFSGIYKGFAQNPSGNITPDSSKTITLSMQKPAVKLYPNPAKNKIILEVKGFFKGFVQLQIIDINGIKARDDKRYLVNGTENVTVMFFLQPGIYFILIKQNETVIKQKMLVQ